MSLKTKQNERSWAIQVIKTVEAYSKGKNYVIKKVGGEETISEGRKKMFPDVLLFGDERGTNILQGWELKMPDVSISDDTFVKDAWRKAETLGLNSTFIWNFRCGIFYVKNATSGVFEEVKRWDNSAIISKSREDVATFHSTWEQALRDAIDTINIYLTTKKYREITIGEALSSKVIEDIINQSKVLVAEKYAKEQMKNLVFHNYIEVWWSDVKEEYINEESDCNVAYAKVITLNWITKFLVAHLIRQRSPLADDITKINKGTSPKEALLVFLDITEKCDFFSIFNPMEYQEILPEETWDLLIDVHLFLLKNGSNILSQEDFQRILENTTTTSNRVIIGQFTTPKTLAEFMVKSTIVDPTGICIDPCCGSGTIPKEIIKYKYLVLKDYKTAYSTTYAADKFSFPLQITNVSLTSTDTMNIPCRVFQKDVFSLQRGEQVQIVDPSNGSTIEAKIDNISYIISNLPFIDFNKNNKHKLEREEVANRIISTVRAQTGIELDYRSDYAFFIIFHLWSLLNNRGTACIITSNSWMGTESGAKFFSALRYYYHIKRVYISAAERWFKNAKIVSTVFILEKKPIGEEPEAAETVYFRMNRRLRDFTERDMNRAIQTSLTLKEPDPDILSYEIHSFGEIEDICGAFNLSRQISFINFSWLAAFKLFVKPLSVDFESFPGIKSGDDKLFYDKSRSKVDKCYYSPMLKNSKSCATYLASPDDFVINCSSTYAELSETGHKKTIDYFKSKENSLNQSTRGHGKLWWKIPQIENRATLFTPLNPNRRMFFGKLDPPSVINQRLVGYSPRRRAIDVELYHAILNSIFSIFLLEAMGFGRGDGVLDLTRTKLGNIMVLDPDLISASDKDEIKRCFSVLCHRAIQDTLEAELEQEDRVRFDLAVLKAFGMENYYGRIKESLLSLHQIRFSVKS